LEVSLSTIPVPATARVYTVAVTSNTSWSVSSNVSWAALNKSSGTGNGDFTITVDGNASTSARNGTISVTATMDGQNITKTVTLNQEASKGYTIEFDDQYGYCITIPDESAVAVFAFVKDSQGGIISSPELVSMIYESDSGTINTTGVFTVDELWPSGNYDTTKVTATATLIGGGTLTAVAYINVLADEI
jgi:hypothetical protein